ncbi:MFS transporter [Geodermatophilus sp. URMC 64]
MTVPVLAVVAVLLVPGGMAWLWVLMGVSGALRVLLPQWVRARGLSTFNMVFAASQATGSRSQPADRSLEQGAKFAPVDADAL